jgi:RHS repeat-associated protein
MGLALALSPIASSQAGTRYVNGSDPTCQGQAPCYRTIQAAVNAAQAGEAVRIQAGSYREQVTVQGKNDFRGANEGHRIVIEADPQAPVGSVVLAGAASACANGYAIRVLRSRFVTIRGLTITGAGGRAIALLAGANQNQAIHIERNRIFGNGSSSCNGGITVNTGNLDTLIANNLIYANGLDGLAFLDGSGGPNYVVNNTIHANGWNGVHVTRGHQVFLVNNLITKNGVATGSTGGRFGVKRQGSSTPKPQDIHLLNNLICGNRLGEIDGFALDSTDAGNLTPTGSEGPGVSGSPACQIDANVYADVSGPDGVADTDDDDFTPAPASPALDRGMDPRTLGLDPLFDPIFEADFSREDVRPSVASPTGTRAFDLGALEVTDERAPTVEILAPAAGAHVRGALALQARAADVGSGVDTLSFTLDGQPLGSFTNPDPTEPFIAGTSLNTATRADGSHTLGATAVDRDANSASTSQSLIIDNTPPDTQLTGGPTGEIQESGATFAFSGSDNLTPLASLRFAWRLDGGSFTAFSSATSAQISDLTEGPHTFEVKARDLAGNDDPVPASQSFSVRLRPVPDFTVSAAPSQVSALQGGQASYAVSVNGSGGFAGLVSLAVSGLPSGVTGTFTPPFLAPGQSGSLTLQVGASAAAATTSFSVTGSAIFEGASRTRSVSLAVQVLAGGRTALGGQFLTTDGAPIAGVQLRLDAVQARTDAAGNFFLLDVPAGAQQLMIDANAARPGFPIYAVEVTLTAGQTTVLPPLRITPPPLPERFIPFNNASQDQVITDPRFPGLAVTLPAGVTITGWDGVLKTKLAIERLSPDRLPVPPPPGQTRSLYQLYFGTPMGGIPSAPLPVALPNDQDLAPGDQAEIWYYDASPLGGPAGWRLAGLGTVSADGATVVSDPGVGLARFCGVCGLMCIIANQATQASRNPNGPTAGEPVDLTLGQFIVEKTDLVLPGRLPALVHRTHNPFDPFGGIAGFQLGLGPGWALSVDVVLLEESASLRRLVLPGNARFPFVRQPDGSFVNLMHPRFAGAVLTQAGSTHTLRFKDRTVWRFASGWVANALPIAGLGLLIEQTDRNGNRLTVSRNTHGDLTQLTEPGGRALTFTTIVFDPQNPASTRITQITDPLGRTVRYGYASAAPFRLLTVTDPAGGLTRYTYTASGGVLSITDPRGTTFLSHEYDAQGRVARQTQADGGVWAFAYEGPAGRHTRAIVTDPRGHASVYRMDNRGFAHEIIDPFGQPTRFERDARGQVTAIADPLGRVTRFEYDGAGNVTRLTDPAGHVRTFAYEPTFNRITAITDPLSQTTSFEYDGTGNLTASVDPLGARTTIAYNAFGQPTSVTDSLGNSTTFGYDGVGNLTTITDPLGNTITRTYDAASRLLSQTDPRSQATRFAYDSLNRLTRITDPLGGVTGFTYDANGNLLTVSDARGNTITHAYDSMDRLASRTDPVGAGETFEYDGLGNLVRQVDRNRQVNSFTYDALNRRAGASYGDGASTTFAYDAVGRQTQATDSIGGTIVNVYDLLDRLGSQTTDLGTVSYQYDALGRRTQMTVQGQAPVGYTYDAASRLRTITQFPLGSVTLDYDTSGRRTGLRLPNGVFTEYQYDADSRLTALIYRNATGTLGDLTYQYDPAGNRTRVGGSFARTLLPDAVDSATYNPANRQLAFGGNTMTYDVNGNLTSITDAAGTDTFAWDARNRLTGIIGPGLAASFAYDALGRRTRKTINGSTTEYLYDGLDLAQELTNTGSASYLSSLTIDEPLARNDAEFYLADALGSVLALTDRTGAVRTRYSYEPFGDTGVEGAASANSFQFTSRENDGVTGLHAYRFRYYSPTLHSFLSEDPIGALGGLNLYRYVLNNPISFTDPLGLDVTVTLYPGATIFGHVGVGVNSSGTVGHYPLDNSVAMLIGEDVPGIVARDRRRPIHTLTIPTSSAQDDAMQRIITEALGKPRPYNFFSRNCTIFVEEVLRAGGLQVPNTILPIRLMGELQQTYGERRGVPRRAPLR